PPSSTLLPYTTLFRSSHVITVSQNWPADGGGLHRVDIDCATGTPTLVGRQVESKNAWSVLSLGGGRWAIAGKGAGGVEDGTEVQDRKSTRLNSSHVKN